MWTRSIGTSSTAMTFEFAGGWARESVPAELDLIEKRTREAADHRKPPPPTPTEIAALEAELCAIVRPPSP
jgi:hypothetical protein